MPKCPYCGYNKAYIKFKDEDGTMYVCKRCRREYYIYREVGDDGKVRTIKMKVLHLPIRFKIGDEEYEIGLEDLEEGINNLRFGAKAFGIALPIMVDSRRLYYVRWAKIRDDKGWLVLDVDGFNLWRLAPWERKGKKQ